jgi:thiol-disulfide isomerase/thioredoxin
MVHTFSKMLQLGTTAPNFTLSEVVSGEIKSLDQLKSDKATVLMFISNHCPYVKHYNSELARISSDYIPKGISFIAISSNDTDAFPDDSPAKLKEQALTFGFKFPYLFDQTQQVAKVYQAACTPDFFVFDGNMKLIYRGQLDSSRPKNNEPVTGNDLRNVLEAILKGLPVAETQTPSSGCNIKWKAGVSPF